MYTDGVLVGQCSTTCTGFTPSAGHFKAGGNVPDRAFRSAKVGSWQNMRSFNGKVAELVVVDGTALNVDEIKELIAGTYFAEMPRPQTQGGDGGIQVEAGVKAGSLHLVPPASGRGNKPSAVAFLIELARLHACVRPMGVRRIVRADAQTKSDPPPLMMCWVGR